VRHMVAIDYIVVPVPLAGLQCRSLESEGALPAARLGGFLVLGQRKLAAVVVPRANQVDGLDARGSAKRERELNGRHDYIGVFFLAMDLRKLTNLAGSICDEQEELVSSTSYG